MDIVGVDTAEMSLKELILQECYTNRIVKSMKYLLI